MIFYYHFTCFQQMCGHCLFTRLNLAAFPLTAEGSLLYYPDTSTIMSFRRNSYWLLLAVVDWAYINVSLEKLWCHRILKQGMLVALSGFRIMIWGWENPNTTAPSRLGSQENYLHVPSRYREDILSGYQHCTQPKITVPQNATYNRCSEASFNVNLHLNDILQPMHSK